MTSIPGPPAPGPRTSIRGTPPGVQATLVQRTRIRAGQRRAITPRDPQKGFVLVDLSALHPPAVLPLGAHRYLTTPKDQGFVLDAATRNWTSVQDHFGPQALDAAHELVRAGAIVLRCEIVDYTLGPPVRWWRTALAAAESEDRVRRRTRAATRSDRELRAALATLDDFSREHPNLPTESLHRALERESTRPGRAPKTAAILIALARDLENGVIHPNPRSFSLAHTRDSKTWDDAPALLRVAGIDPYLIELIGLTRSARLGVGGCIDATADGRPVPLHLLVGPTLLRADQRSLELITTGDTLLVIENLQAAETLCTLASSTTAVLYTAGRPGQPVLRHIVALAEHSQTVVLAPDADLGGVRIAEAILTALPSTARHRTLVCDVGAVPHDRQPPWPVESVSWKGLHDALQGPAADLARACLTRGYRVEQEASTVAAVEAILATRSRESAVRRPGALLPRAP